MKTREPRIKVILPARLRWEGRWVTATIRNLSSRGLMVAAPAPPPPGTYVEVQVASQVITARTVWTQEQLCGLLAQGRLDVGQLCGGSGTRPTPDFDRRATPRASVRQQADNSRQLASLFQYAVAVAFALTAAGSVGWEVYKTLSAPMTAIEAKLSSGE